MHMKSLTGIAIGGMLLIAVSQLAIAQDEPAAPNPETEKSSPTAPETADPKWLDRMPKDDRAALDEVVGYAPPAFTNDLKWLDGNPTTWENIRGKVIIVQSWTSGTAQGKKWPTRLAGMIKDFPQDQIFAIALHTPEDVDQAEAHLARQAAPENIHVVIDADGDFCDALGIYKEPVNILVDRNGTLRYAGLSPKGLEQAVAALLAEPFDNTKRPRVKQQESGADETQEKSGEFPAITGKIDNALDVRGQRAPEFFIDEWITSKPDPSGKVVILDFWATWCGPCVQSIPHMNSLATRFADQVCIVGISDEKQNDFNKGMDDKKIKPENIKYALALDPAAKMKSALQIRGIPHCIVMSKDWIVRWQGHPGSLSPQILEKIIKADGAAAATAPAKSKKPGAKPRGWKTS